MACVVAIARVNSSPYRSPNPWDGVLEMPLLSWTLLSLSPPPAGAQHS